MRSPPSIRPITREETWWQERFSEHCVTATHAHFDLVLLGDSITHEWEAEGAEMFDKYFCSMQTLNLGYAGDRTEHLLWRIQHGHFDSLHCEWLNLLIGTNNAGHRNDSPKEILEGIDAILEEIHTRMPTCKVILNALFPRSKKPQQRMRIKIDEVNAELVQRSDNAQIFWLDMAPLFLNEVGILEANIMPDFLHPNAAQYEKWAKEIIKIIRANSSSIR